MTLVPKLEKRLATAAEAPCPIASSAITAPTPMMMPSIVSAVRSLFAVNARRAMSTLCTTIAVPSTRTDELPTRHGHQESPSLHFLGDGGVLAVFFQRRRGVGAVMRRAPD